MRLDSPDRFSEIRRVITAKYSLRKWYEELYLSYSECLKQCPPSGLAIELGSGAGLTKEFVTNVLTTDVIEYPDVDKIVDATQMDFETQSLKAILMLNVLHHIPDSEAFFREAERCLLPGGRLLIIDQYPGLWAKLILKYAHHEAFDDQTSQWKFPSTGPLSGANGALAWIIFFRDRKKFESLYPNLKLRSIRLHTPLRYWLSGGLKKWNLLPKSLYSFATRIDHALAKMFPHLSSFMTVEIVKT